VGWRLIDTDITDPYYVTAADDAIAQTRKENIIPNTLHFYRRDPPAVSIGRSQSIHDIDLNVCNRHNVQIIRRITGGGSIYTDKNCLIYSLIFDSNDTKLYSNQEIFENICNILVKALKELGIQTNYKPPNDILFNNKKISGSAQIKKGNIILIHGTILINTDLELMKQILKQKTKTTVSTLHREIKNPPSFNNLKNVLTSEFEKYFKEKITPSTLISKEEKLIQQLIDKRYLNTSWTYRR